MLGRADRAAARAGSLSALAGEWVQLFGRGVGLGPKPYRQWACTRTLADGTVDAVFVDADEHLVKNILAIRDVSATTTHLTGSIELFTLVASIDLGAPTNDVESWISSHVDSGGQATIGHVLVTLDEPREVRYLALFVQS